MTKGYLLSMLGALGAALWCSSAGGASVNIVDEFARFETAPAQVAIEDTLEAAPWRTVRLGANKLLCEKNQLNLHVENKGEIRLISRQALVNGTFEGKLRFNGIKKSNVFIALSTVNPWMKYGASLGIVNDGVGHFGYEWKALPFRFKDGAWYEFKIQWHGATAKLTIDGISYGDFDVVTNEVPLYPMVVVNSKEKLDVEIDRLCYSGKIPDAKNVVRDEVVRPMIAPELPEPAAAPATVSADKSQAVLENRYFKAVYSWKNGDAVLSQWFNKFTKRDMVVKSAPFVKAFRDNGEVVDFKFVSAKADGNKLVIVLRSQKKSLELTYTAEITENSPEIRSSVSLKNLSSKKFEASVVHPVLIGLRVGKEYADDGFFYPFESGMAGQLDYQLGHTYGVTALLQVMCGYDAVNGGSFYAYTSDKTGQYSLLSIRRQAGNERVDQYEPIAPTEELRTRNILGSTKGISMSWRHLKRPVEPGKSVEFPAAVLGVSGTDWRAGLASYGKFVRSWWKRQMPPPKWYDECYIGLSGHPNSNLHLLSPKRHNGYFNIKTMKYAYAEQMGNWERDGIMEIAYWTDYDKEEYSTLTTAQLGRLGRGGMQIGNAGSYKANSWRGGMPALRQEIADVHAKGGRLLLYTFPDACNQGSDLDRMIGGKKYGMMGIDGKYSSSYTEEGKGWTCCFYEPVFAEAIGKTFAQVVKESGCDGVRLDTMARTYGCYNPEHSHFDGTMQSAHNPERLGQTILTIKKAIREVNPEAAVSSEHAGNDWIAQYTDAFFSQNISWLAKSGRWAPFRKLNGYKLVFSRFVLPECKVWIHSGCDHVEAARMGLFNGVPVCCTTSIGAVAAKTLAENADTFVSAEVPTPLVPTLKKDLLANYFPGKKPFYTFYNCTGNAVSGDVIAVPQAPAKTHYVEVYRDLPVTVTQKEGKDVLAFAIPKDEAAAVAILPQILSAKIDGGKLEIISASALDEVEVIVDEDDFRNPGATVKLNGGKGEFTLPAKYKRIIVKAHQGKYLLDEIIVANPAVK